MTLALAAGHALARAGLIVDAACAVAALLVGGATRRAAIALALALTPALLLAELWHSTQVEHLRHHRLEAAAAIIVAIALVVALAAVLRSRPRLGALCAVIALPFRFSVLAGGTGGILIPLYVVIWAMALAYVAWPAAADRGEPPVGWLERALAIFVGLYAIQALYTPAPSLSRAVEEVGFFLVPFALLFVLLRGVRWDRRLVARCAQAVVALAVLFTIVAAIEYASRDLIFDASLNSNERYFRVNSLFYDPNIFGRFLALTMLLVTVWMLWGRGARTAALAAAALAVLWLGLLGTVSQSSMLALLAGLAVVAAARYSVRATAVVVVILVGAGVAIAVAASGSLHLNFSDTASANNSTGGRASLVKEGVDLFADRPLAGWGSASFSCEYLRHTTRSRGCAVVAGVTSDSHTIPITVAAEQGVIGLAAYVLLLGAALWRLGGGALRRDAARVAILAAFAALVVHTWAYADFLEDPITWTLLSVGTVLAAA